MISTISLSYSHPHTITPSNFSLIELSRTMMASHINNQTDSGSLVVVDNYFDALPDPILLLILDKILDSGSLHRCLLISKRFASLVPLVTSISISVPRSSDHHSSNQKKKSPSLSLIRSLISRLMMTKFLCLDRKALDYYKNSKKEKDNVDCGGGGGNIDVYKWTSRCINNFASIRSIEIELPSSSSHGDESGGPFIKWTAEFDTELRSCVILAADSIHPIMILNSESESESISNRDLNYEDSPLSDDVIKTRILWTISSLLAGSARHSLIKRILITCPNLTSSVTIRDACGQGILTMSSSDVTDLRNSIGSSTYPTMCGLWEKEERTCVPEVDVVMWYVEEFMEVKTMGGGVVMRGATVMVVLRKGEKDDEGERVLLRECVEKDRGVVGDVVREMMLRRKKVCKLEMNSF